MTAAFLLLAVQLAEARWGVLLACPQVLSPGNATGTGVVIGIEAGFAYLLTANHVAASDRVEVRFTSRDTFPRTAWFGDGATVVARWPDPDLALVRFPLHKHTPTVLPLASSWQRPKAFPVPAIAVGWEREAAAVRDDTIRGKEFVKREGKEPAFFWRTRTAPEPGQSGGPLLDSRGRVIGIAVATRDGAGYFAHHDEILAALKREGHGRLVPPP